MKISGFTFIKNGTKLYIPLREAIESVLPICDEFIVAMGDNDEDDFTEEEIRKIDSDKIKIVRTTWDREAYPKNTVFARETDKALDECTGDWLFYIQCDEAVHEKYLEGIRHACQKYLNDERVEGFLFQYKHFWGDFWHYHKSHGWYPKEVRIIRNHPQIHSWRDAQGFRFYDEFNYTYDDYREKVNNRKLRVIELNAEVFHYGYARPPDFMTRKRKSNYTSYHGEEQTKKAITEKIFDYGPMDKVYRFDGEHPAVMKDWISKFDWADLLQKTGKRDPHRPPHKHEKFKNRVLTFIEQNFLGGNHIFTRKNYVIIGRFPVTSDP